MVFKSQSADKRLMGNASVGVLGGGISGLTFAAHHDDSVILEKDPEVGGLCRSVRLGGYTFDLGSHIIFTKDPNVRSFFLSTLGKNVITHRRNTRIAYKGKLIKYPFENGLCDLDIHERYACAENYIETYIRRERGELARPKNFMEWMRFRFGDKITDAYLAPYNRKVWNCDPSEMDYSWVEGRVPQPPVSDILKSCMGLACEGYTEQLNFWYPENGGYQSLTDSIAKSIGKERIECGFAVERLKKEGNEWVVFGNKGKRNFKRLVSTINVIDFLAMLPDVPSSVQKAACGLRWNSIHLTMVSLGKTAKKNDMHWLYVPEESFLPNRVSFPSNMSGRNVPEGCFSILAETTIPPEGRYGEGEITGKVVDDLESMSLISHNDVVAAKTITLDYAYPVYDLNHSKNTKTIYDYVESLGGIDLLGRFSEFMYYNADKCAGNAISLAKSMAESE